MRRYRLALMLAFPTAFVMPALAVLVAATPVLGQAQSPQRVYIQPAGGS